MCELTAIQFSKVVRNRRKPRRGSPCSIYCVLSVHSPIVLYCCGQELPQYGLRDQAAIRQAIWQTPDLHDYVLPDVWQCRVPKRMAVTCENHELLTQSVQLLGDRIQQGVSAEQDLDGTRKKQSRSPKKSRQREILDYAHDISTTCVVLHGYVVAINQTNTHAHTYPQLVF